MYHRPVVALGALALFFFGLNAYADALPGTTSTDPFDSTQGTVIGAHDTIVDPLNAFTTSGGFENGHTLMRNGGLGSVSFIEFETSGTVFLDGIRMFAANDGAAFGFRRTMSGFRLLADTDNDNVYETVVLDQPINPNYSLQPGNVAAAANALDYTLTFPQVIASRYRLEVTQGSNIQPFEGARIIELDAIGVFGVPDPCADPSTATITGTEGSDYILGTPGDDIIFALGGDDVVDAFGGNDIICGGAGLDTLLGREGNDYIDGGAGYNWIQGHAGDDTLVGGDDGNEIFGYEGDDLLYGGAGDDHMNGWLGNDFLVGGAGADDLYGHEGDDEIHGEAGDDTIFGGAGNDCINGGDGADLLYGGDGDDCLTGGVGGDVLTCGGGNDTFTSDASDAAPDVSCETSGVCACE